MMEGFIAKLSNISNRDLVNEVNSAVQFQYICIVLI